MQWGPSELGLTLRIPVEELKAMLKSGPEKDIPYHERNTEQASQSTSVEQASPDQHQPEEPAAEAADPKSDAINEALQQIEGFRTIDSKNEFAELPNVLVAGELPEMVIKCAQGFSNGLMVATDRRVVWLRKGKKLDVREISYADMVSVIAKKAGGSIVFATKTDNLEVINTTKALTINFADHVRGKIDTDATIVDTITEDHGLTETALAGMDTEPVRSSAERPPLPPPPPLPLSVILGPLGNPGELVARPGAEEGTIALTWSPAANASAHLVYFAYGASEDVHELPQSLPGDCGAIDVTGVPSGFCRFVVIARQENAEGEAVEWSEWSNWATLSL